MESGTIKKQGTANEMTSTLKELNTSLHRPKRLFKNETIYADGTSRERHKLVRLLSRQTLYRTVSSQVSFLLMNKNLAYKTMKCIILKELFFR